MRYMDISKMKMKNVYKAPTFFVCKQALENLVCSEFF